jgi:hypothetical protein
VEKSRTFASFPLRVYMHSSSLALTFSYEWVTERRGVMFSLLLRNREVLGGDLRSETSLLSTSTQMLRWDLTTGSTPPALFPIYH